MMQASTVRALHKGPQGIGSAGLHEIQQLGRISAQVLRRHSLITSVGVVQVCH